MHRLSKVLGDWLDPSILKLCLPALTGCTKAISRCDVALIWSSRSGDGDEQRARRHVFLGRWRLNSQIST
jgi:hypothetical protein